MPRETLSTVTSFRILIPIILLLIVLSVYLKRQKLNHQSHIQFAGKRICRIDLFVFILLMVYLLIYVNLTFTYRQPAKRSRINLTPFWSYQSAIQFFPPKIKRLGLARQILLNILLTIPPGLLLPLLYHQTKHPNLWTVFTILMLSILTETLQYFTRRGLCETDDLLDNFLGALLGLGIISIFGRIIANMKRKTKKTEQAQQQIQTKR